MKHIVLVVFLAVVAINVVKACNRCSCIPTNYCSDEIYCNGSPHIGCGHSGNFASTCSQDAVLVDMSDSLKDAIVHLHNEKRNFVAGGGDPNHDPACRMATMQWDEELAYLASLNVKQCEMKHDSCRSTNQFYLSGQNLAYLSFYDTANAYEKFAGAIDMWYSEIENSNMDYINAYPSNYNGPTIGHFTAMMGEKNHRIGCAASTYSRPSVSYNYFLIACNYATTNVIGGLIYASCPTATSDCTTGKNPTYRNLCSTCEAYTFYGHSM